MKRRRLAFLAAALVLFGLAAFLMARGDDAAEPEEKKVIEFPRALRPAEVQRMNSRRTGIGPAVPLAVEKSADLNPPPPPPQAADPVLAALGAGGDSKSAIVIEANALRYSPVGELLLECLKNRDGGRRLERLKKLSGINPVEDVDRLALGDDVVIVSGQFAKARWGQLFPGMLPSPYGEHGTIFKADPNAPQVPGAPRRGPDEIAAWKEQLLVMGKAGKVEATLDRLEGRVEPGKQLLTEQETYGEIYGVLSPDAVGQLLGEEQQELARRFSSAAQRVELHVDATSDVAMTAEIKGEDGQQVQDLGKSLGAALSLGRLKMQSDGQKDAAELMDLARVVRRGHDEDSFRLEMAVPLPWIQKRLAFCKERNLANPESEDDGIPPTSP